MSRELIPRLQSAGIPLATVHGAKGYRFFFLYLYRHSRYRLVLASHIISVIDMQRDHEMSLKYNCGVLWRMEIDLPDELPSEDDFASLLMHCPRLSRILSKTFAGRGSMVTRALTKLPGRAMAEEKKVLSASYFARNWKGLQA